MRERWRINEGAAVATGIAWMLLGFVVVVTLALTTHRHSTAVRIAVGVWVTPILGVVFGVLWWVARDEFGERLRFGVPFRRVREPVTKDLREK